MLVPKLPKLNRHRNKSGLQHTNEREKKMMVEKASLRHHAGYARRSKYTCSFLENMVWY